MISPIVVAAVGAVAVSVCVPLILSIFRANYKLIEVVLIGVATGLISLIPVLGGTASLMALFLLLYWRCRADVFPELLLAVGTARLAMIPMLMPFTHT